MGLLDDVSLEATSVVANNRMNRERQIRGSNGYDRELGFDVIAFLREVGRPACWLDVCCGSGRALVETEALLPEAVLVGVDLVEQWWPRSAESRVQLAGVALRQFVPDRAFHLVTAVHGLPYVGDKLGALMQLRSWLTHDGRLAAHLDLAHVLLDDRPLKTAQLRALGFEWNARHHLVSATGSGTEAVLPRYLGAAETGPTFAGQPAVASYYRS